MDEGGDHRASLLIFQQHYPWALAANFASDASGSMCATASIGTQPDARSLQASPGVAKSPRDTFALPVFTPLSALNNSAHPPGTGAQHAGALPVAGRRRQEGHPSSSAAHAEQRRASPEMRPFRSSTPPWSWLAGGS